MLFIFLFLASCGQGHYETRIAHEGDVVFYGDSITRLCRNYTDGLNRSVPGSTSGEMLEVIEQYDDDEASYRILIGVNDIIKGVEPVYLLNINKALALLDGPVVVTSILPTASKAINYKIVELNSGLEALADIHAATYRNVYEKFLLGEVLNPIYTFDGIHLNEAGCSLLF
jgi:lysophospholipase L1-like esterase